VWIDLIFAAVHRFPGTAMATTRIGFGIALLLASAIGASAADMPVKYKAPPPDPWNWGGLYGGVNAGYSFGRDTVAEDTQVGAGRVLPTGGVVGGQLGYNWQSGRFVLGFEGDAQWSGQSGRTCSSSICFQNFNEENFAGNYEHKLKWFATARARLGLANAGTLFYLTGGAAWAGVSETTTWVVDNIPASITANHSLTGWAFGGGIEGRLSQDWTVKAEYLHLEFAPMGMSGRYAGASGPVSFDLTSSSSGRVTDNIVRVGLNRRLWNGPAAAPPRPDPAETAWRWTGLYAGLNAGYGVGNGWFREFEFIDPSVPPSPTELTHYFSSYAPQRISPQGALAGGQLGYNWQFDRLVIGVEGDAQWSGQKDTACAASCTSFLGAETLTQQFNWLATVRGRLGYAERGYLFYVTAGGALAEIQETELFSDFNSLIPSTFKRTNGGWVGGAGIEAWVFGNWTVKAEYLHFDLGSVSHTYPTGVPVGVFNLVTSLGSQAHVRNDVVRIGLNYKLTEN
jgi:outer membrane immunogenic protein